MGTAGYDGEWEAPPFAELAEALGLGVAYQLLVAGDGAERRFTRVSGNCEAITGLAREVLLADAAAFYGLIDPDDRRLVAEAEASALLDDGRLAVEFRMLGADGEVRCRRMVARGRQHRDPGEVVWDGLITDITESRRISDQLEEQRWRLEVAVEATNLGFWQWDVGSNALKWSERNKAMFGFPPDAPINIEMYLATIHPDDLERCRRAFQEARDRPGGGDFSIEYRVVAVNGQLRWMLTRGRVVCDETGAVSLMVGTNLDVTERHEADERRSLVLGELAHRAKNGLGVMMAIIAETAHTAESVKGFKEVLLARLQAMAQAQDLVTTSGGHPVRLADLAEQALAPFGLMRFDLETEVEGLTVHGDVAAGLALLLHEMATNATKYGALSRPEGRVALRAEGAGPGMGALHWRERGGPPVVPSNRRGFGSKLLQAALRPQGGKVEPAFEPDGFRARMEFRVLG